MNKKIVIFLIHFSAWIIAGFFGAAIAYITFPPVETSFFILTAMAYTYYMLVSFYTFYLFLVPKFLEKKKYKQFIIYGLLVVFVEFSLDQLFWIGIDYPQIDVGYSYIGVAIGALCCGVLGVFYRFGVDWFKNIEIRKELEHQNLLSELSLIKSRLNPHFLFNTLNNIDTLIQTNPEQASMALSKLSEILRYAVYSTTNKKVSFQNEVDTLEKYIALEKMRLINPNAVQFKSEVPNEVRIPPMLFFPFIENGFKHSDLNQPNHKLNISIEENQGKIVFKCSNTINENKQDSNASGVGLELVKKRLNLLFPETHTLTIDDADKTFRVALDIQID